MKLYLWHFQYGVYDDNVLGVLEDVSVVVVDISIEKARDSAIATHKQYPSCKFDNKPKIYTIPVTMCFVEDHYPSA